MFCQPRQKIVDAPGMTLPSSAWLTSTHRAVAPVAMLRPCVSGWRWSTTWHPSAIVHFASFLMCHEIRVFAICTVDEEKNIQESPGIPLNLFFRRNLAMFFFPGGWDFHFIVIPGGQEDFDFIILNFFL